MDRQTRASTRARRIGTSAASLAIALVLGAWQTAAKADPPIIPQGAEGWWSWVLRNVVPIGVGLTLFRFWVQRDQDRKNDAHELRMKSIEDSIGLPPGTTVKATIDGVGEKVDRIRSDCSRHDERIGRVETDVREITLDAGRTRQEFGAVQGLIRQSIEQGASDRDTILSAIHKSSLEAAERDATMRERMARVESNVDMASVLKEGMNAQAAMLRDALAQLRGGNGGGR